MSLAACERTVTRVEETAAKADNCFDCHNDQNTILIAAHQQWANSFHASGHSTQHRNYSVRAPAAIPAKASYPASRATARASYPNATMIHCFTCHAPHTNSLGGLCRRRFRTPGRRPADAGHHGCFVRYRRGQHLRGMPPGPPERCGHLCCTTANDTVSFGDNNTLGATPQRVHSDNLFGSKRLRCTRGTRTCRNRSHQGPHQWMPQRCHYRRHAELRRGWPLLQHEAGIIGGHDGRRTEIVNQDACLSCHDLDAARTWIGFDHNGRQTEIKSPCRIRSRPSSRNAGPAGQASTTCPFVVTSSDSAGAVWNWLMVHEDRQRRHPQLQVDERGCSNRPSCSWRAICPSRHPLQ